MARFRKGTTDHDGDGKKGGSLKAGSRFVKGTNDPDNDGHRGGSLPKGEVAMAKKRKTKAEPAQAEAKTKEAPADTLPEAQPTLEGRKQAAAEMFAEADAAAVADENRLRLAVRGF